MADALQKLAALDAGASDRDRGTYLIPGGAQRVENERQAARDKLAALSHLLLPVFEALYAITRESRKGMGAVQSADLIRGHKVLAQLEEALNAD